jgi:hypothetical protein
MATSIKVITVFFLLFIFLSPAASQVYQWKDKDGNIYFSDSPPSAGDVKEMKTRKDLDRPSERNWEHFNTHLNVESYYDPRSITSPGKDKVRRVWVKEIYTNTNTYYETLIEMDCQSRRYRDISTAEFDMKGKKIKDISVDSYVHDDGGFIKKGSDKDILSRKVCR